MKLIYTETQKEFEAEVLDVSQKDMAYIRQSGQFVFDWQKEMKHHVYKIVNTSESKRTEIIGLMSLIDVPEELRIQISLIESANINKGKNKEIDRIAGCLLAFAARISFEKGYMGFISLIPKTELIELYVKKYGFKQYGMQLAMEGTDSIDLINKYL